MEAGPGHSITFQPLDRLGSSNGVLGHTLSRDRGRGEERKQREAEKGLAWRLGAVGASHGFMVY